MNKYIVVFKMIGWVFIILFMQLIANIMEIK
jgi:hypothetical protein